MRKFTWFYGTCVWWQKWKSHKISDCIFKIVFLGSGWIICLIKRVCVKLHGWNVDPVLTYFSCILVFSLWIKKVLEKLLFHVSCCIRVLEVSFVLSLWVKKFLSSSDFFSWVDTIIWIKYLILLILIYMWLDLMTMINQQNFLYSFFPRNVHKMHSCNLTIEFPFTRLSLKKLFPI